MNYAIRITASFKELETFVTLIRSQCSSCVIYEHEASRVHIHGFLKDCKVSTDTLKNYVKRALNVTTFPKNDWSFKTIHEGGDVDDNFITYMSKGILEPVFVHNYDPVAISMFKSKWVDIVPRKKREMVQYKLKVENPREAKIRQNELMDMVLQRCRETSANQPEQILEIIRQVVYIEHRTIVGRYKMRDYYDYVMGWYRPETWVQSMQKIILIRDI